MENRALRILVIDDSTVARTMISRELGGAGYQVWLAESGQEGLAQFSALTPDLVTVDVGLPDLDGYEVARRLRAQQAQAASTPAGSRPAAIVFLTASDSLDARERGFAVGASDFVLKPFAPGELLAVVDRILRPGSEYAGRTALVVDDDFLARMVLAHCLRPMGLTVIEAENGEQALKLAHEHCATLDLVVTDVVMPGMQGDELCRRIKAQPELRDVPVIALSAASDAAKVLQLFRSGVTDYVVKPFTKEVLVARVTSHLRGRALVRDLGRRVDDLKRLHNMNSRLLAFVSHDLKTPVAGMLGMAAMLQEEDLSNEDRLEMAKRIQVSGEGLLQTINNLTDLGKLELGDGQITLQLQPLRGVIDAAVKNLAALAERKGVALSFESPKGLSPVPVDVESVLRIATNLISNAIKFTKSGGSVRVSIVNDDEQSQQLVVVDTGIGMEASLLSGLWSASPKASRTGTGGEKGTGLGLRIVRSLVENLGGSLHAESAVGVGTTVTVTFPGAARQEKTAVQVAN